MTGTSATRVPTHRGHAPRCAALAVLIVTSLVAREARAQDAPRERAIAAAITVDDPTGCLGAPGLLEEIAGWLRRDRVDARVSVAVHLRVAPSPSLGFEVRRAGAAPSIRRFDTVPDRCDDARALVALSVALAIDAAVLDAVASARAPALPVAPRASGPRVVAGAAGGVLVGALPGTLAPMASAWAGLRWAERYTVRLGAFGAGGGAADLGTGRVAAQLVAARLDGCFASLPRLVAIESCAGAAGGVVLGQGQGFAPSVDAGVPWVAVVARVALRVRLAAVVALELAADGLVPVVVAQLEAVTVGGTVAYSWSSPPAAFGATLGAVVAFP